MQRNVYIVGQDSSVRNMFHSMGWEVTSKIDEADLVQFTGGADVSPMLYNQMPHKKCFFDPERDYREQLIYSLCLKNKIPMSGICRGGQFLHVMNGGEMFQHVDNHAVAGTHECVDVFTGNKFQVTSTHHQMMKWNDEVNQNAVLIGVSEEASKREWMIHKSPVTETVDWKRDRKLQDKDIEILFYPKTKALCFQPHPEYAGYQSLKNIYFSYINTYIFAA